MLLRSRRWRWGSPRRSWGLRLLAWGLGALVLGTALPILALRWIDPPTSAFMLQSRLANRDRPDWRLHHVWVEERHIAPSMARAVIASEDQRFDEHAGFDLHSIAEAVSESRRGGRQRGASTISQQVAKNLFLWPEKSFLRKGLEAWLTLWIELLWPKARILEVYLNVAEFGDGIFGVEAASRLLFDKPAAALGADESARLAAVLPSPRRLHAARPSPYLRERADWILGQMGYSAGGADPSPVFEAAESEQGVEPAASEEVADLAPPDPDEAAPAEGEPVLSEEIQVPRDFREAPAALDPDPAAPEELFGPAPPDSFP